MHFIKHWLFRHRAKQPKVSHLLRHCYPRPVIQNQQHGAPSSSGNNRPTGKMYRALSPKIQIKRLKAIQQLQTKVGKLNFICHIGAIRVFPWCYIGWERIRAFILHCYVICFVYNHQSLSITVFFFLEFHKEMLSWCATDCNDSNSCKREISVGLWSIELQLDLQHLNCGE